ncbi:sugar phosphate isomerase/epimerase [Aerococcaceae bacterium DSM 111022]|nr:sugar phosphate isomerase/epimerase [Aerococcaceae bacterium DSM 111022]
MRKGKIGVQMMMLKQEVEEHGIYEVMRRISEMGYHAVEVSQIPMTPEAISEMQRAMKDFDIDIAAMSCGLDDLSPESKYPDDTLRHDFDKIVADCHAVECNILRIGMLPLTEATSVEDMLAVGNIFEEYAVRMKEHGIDLYYHPHNFEFVLVDGEPLIKKMMEQTSALGFELDSHWIWRGGFDPVAVIRAFSGRVRALHLKDYRIGLIEDEELMTRIGYDVFGRIEQFAEVGEGSLDIPAIIEAGFESGCDYFFVEQDDTYGRDVYECLQNSYDNLVEMGYGEYF